MLDVSGVRPAGDALAALISGINSDLDASPVEAPHAIRDRLQAALGCPALFLDCAHLLLKQVAQQPDTRFLFVDPQLRYTLQVFCWPPQFGNSPHLHETWAVSAVFANSILVFRSSLSQDDCLKSEPLLAKAGEAGVLIPPQYHCLRNTTDAMTITFHVFAVDPENRGRLHASRGSASSTRLSNGGILAIAKEASRHSWDGVIDLVRMAFLTAENSTRLDIVKLMAQLAPKEAIPLGRSLATRVAGHDGERLMNLMDRLEDATR